MARIALVDLAHSYGGNNAAPESFVHLHRDAQNWVAGLHGVQAYEPGVTLHAALDPDNVFVFDAADRLVASPKSIAFSSEVPSGSREENASNKKNA